MEQYRTCIEDAGCVAHYIDDVLQLRMFNMSIYYYFAPYTSNVLKTTAVVAAVLTVLQQYCRPFASPIGGFLADKIGRGQVMAGGFF